MKKGVRILCLILVAALLFSTVAALVFALIG